MRGADFTRIGVYLDGILLQEPFHTIQTTGGSGSITAINTDLIGELDLYEGAYPVRFGDRSAGALDIHMRDGNQSRYSFRASASFATTSAMAEGPLGKFNRCSWIAGFRKSHAPRTKRKLAKRRSGYVLLRCARLRKKQLKRCKLKC